MEFFHREDNCPMPERFKAAVVMALCLYPGRVRYLCQKAKSAAAHNKEVVQLTGEKSGAIYLHRNLMLLLPKRAFPGKQSTFEAE